MDLSEFLAWLVTAMMVGALLFGVGLVALVFVAHFDLFPSNGQATGYISYQEKTGMFQLERVCWRDTPYADCEDFAPQVGVRYPPGQYNIDYACRRFCWRWDCASNCRILNATMISSGVPTTQR